MKTELYIFKKTLAKVFLGFRLCSQGCRTAAAVAGSVLPRDPGALVACRGSCLLSAHPGLVAEGGGRTVPLNGEETFGYGQTANLL